jgi:hypothetical protein
MQQHRSSGLGVPLTDMRSAMSAGEKNVNGFHETRGDRQQRCDRAGGGADGASGAPEFRTQVVVGEVTVTSVLPCTARAHAGSIAIGGDVRFLSCDEALELVDALLLVVARMDVVVDERYSTTIHATRDRGLSAVAPPSARRAPQTTRVQIVRDELRRIRDLSRSSTSSGAPILSPSRSPR